MGGQAGGAATTRSNLANCNRKSNSERAGARACRVARRTRRWAIATGSSANSWSPRDHVRSGAWAARPPGGFCIEAVRPGCSGPGSKRPHLGLPCSPNQVSCSPGPVRHTVAPALEHTCGPRSAPFFFLVFKKHPRTGLGVWVAQLGRRVLRLERTSADRASGRGGAARAAGGSPGPVCLSKSTRKPIVGVSWVGVGEDNEPSVARSLEPDSGFPREP